MSYNTEEMGSKGNRTAEASVFKGIKFAWAWYHEIFFSLCVSVEQKIRRTNGRKPQDIKAALNSGFQTIRNSFEYFKVGEVNITQIFPYEYLAKLMKREQAGLNLVVLIFLI